jgi:predicted RNA-binding protein with RPS1 domain
VTEREQQDSQNNPDSPMWELLNQSEYDFVPPKTGDIRQGKVVRVEPHQVAVDIGGKKEGIIPSSELDKVSPDIRARLLVGPLRDMVPILSAHEEEIRQLRAQADSRSQELERYQESLTSQLTHLQSELAALRSLGEAQKQQTQLQLSSLATELRERDEHLLEEQRVCFKQLSLETSEAAILEDRARRKAETVLEDLQRRIEQFEKGKK